MQKHRCLICWRLPSLPYKVLPLVEFDNFIILATNNGKILFVLSHIYTIWELKSVLFQMTRGLKIQNDAFVFCKVPLSRFCILFMIGKCNVYMMWSFKKNKINFKVFKNISNSCKFNGKEWNWIIVPVNHLLTSSNCPRFKWSRNSSVLPPLLTVTYFSKYSSKNNLFLSQYNLY